jgi:hypothetical protein
MSRQESAETLALQALGWLVSNEDLLPVFLGATGASLPDLPANAGRPEFLASVLDFILMDDAWVMALCDSIGRPYDSVLHARAGLPGGDTMHWT